jgi:hypothetical protein
MFRSDDQNVVPPSGTIAFIAGIILTTAGTATLMATTLNMRKLEILVGTMPMPAAGLVLKAAIILILTQKSSKK